MTDYDRIEKVIRYLEGHRHEQPGLERLARVAGLSEAHFHRLFSRWAGTTPKSFLKALTAQHARALLRQSKDLLDVSLEAGLSGPGRLHDLLVTVEGVTPGQYKAMGLGIRIEYGFHPTDFGDCLLGMTERGICHLAFAADRTRRDTLEELRLKWPGADLRQHPRKTAPLVAGVFRQEQPGKRLSVFLAGTPFQLKVWEALLKIPIGRLTTYGEVAAQLGHPGAARAVGSAVGANPIAYLIPCHRVIRETGVLGEYRWGAARKKAIIAQETVADDPQGFGY